MTVLLQPAQQQSGAVALRWKSQPWVQRVHVMRVDFISNRQLQVAEFGPDAWFPGLEQEIGVTEGSSFVDTTAEPDRVYHYYLVAEGNEGARTATSNVVRFPSLAKTSSWITAGQIEQ